MKQNSKSQLRSVKKTSDMAILIVRKFQDVTNELFRRFPPSVSARIIYYYVVSTKISRTELWGVWNEPKFETTRENAKKEKRILRAEYTSRLY